MKQLFYSQQNLSVVQNDISIQLIFQIACTRMDHKVQSSNKIKNHGYYVSSTTGSDQIREGKQEWT